MTTRSNLAAWRVTNALTADDSPGAHERSIPRGGDVDDDKLIPRAEVSVTVGGDALPAPIADALAPATSAPPVAMQRASHTNAAKLESEKVVIAAPLSYAGSAARLWKLTGITANPWARIAIAAAVIILLIMPAWVLVTAWYFTFGLLLVPYRLIRRGSRKHKREALQHRELIGAIQVRDGS